MESAGTLSPESGLLAHDGSLTHNEAVRRKKSLPNIFVLSRQRSQRSLKSTKSPPMTAGVDRTFHPDSSFTKSPSNSNVPPLPSPTQTAIQLKIADAKRRRDEEIARHDETPRSLPADNPVTFRVSSDSFHRPSFSQRRFPHTKLPDITHAPPPEVFTATASHETLQNDPLPPNTALPSNIAAIHRPSQGELDDFDFKLPKRPHTATASSLQISPKHDSYPFPQSLTRPRQVSDAESSWQKSPRVEEFTPPWTQLSREQNRGSSNSGFSTGSSTLDTQRSSVFTKTSSTSDHTIDIDTDDVDDYKEDIIDMYANKPGDLLQAPSLMPDDRGSARDRRRSMLIAQMTELKTGDTMTLQPHLSIPPSPSTPMTPLTPTTPTEEEGQIRLDNHRQHRPPSLGETEPGFDQYGFRKTSRDVSEEAYETWWAEYHKIQNRRTDRWKELMLNNGLPYEDPRCFPEPSGKTRRFVQKGIPPEWRGNAWFFYAGGHEYLDKYPGRYRNLLREAQNGKLTQLDKESIERDLHRTFPDNIHFKPDQSTANTSPDTVGKDQSPILHALRRVLSAFAVDHPKIGYCQSLNFLAGMLLLFLPEERAFWMLHIIATDILPGTHETSLEGANVDLWVLMLAIKDTLPVVWQKLGVMPSETGVGNEMWQPDSIRLPPISLCTTSWFMSLFIGVLPTETVLRVWDMIFYDGARVLFRIALAIFKLGEADIKAIQDPMEIFQVVQSLPRRMIRCGVLMEQAGHSKGKQAVTNSWVGKQRSVRKEFFARERGVEVARKLSRAAARKADKEQRHSKESNSSTAEDSYAQSHPALGEVPHIERTPTRKKSAWSVRRSGTTRKVTNPLA